MYGPSILTANDVFSDALIEVERTWDWVTTKKTNCFRGRKQLCEVPVEFRQSTGSTRVYNTSGVPVEFQWSISRVPVEFQKSVSGVSVEYQSDPHVYRRTLADYAIIYIHQPPVCGKPVEYQ